MIHCPHCGHALDDPRMVLATRTPPRKEQALLDVLTEAWPRPVRVRTMIEAVYGTSPDSGPDDEKNAIRARLHHLRKRLAPAGWTVENEQGVGYRLARLEGDTHEG